MTAAVKEGVRAALAQYLAGALAADFPTLKVLGEWPSPDATLPEYALTVLAPGAPETVFHAAQVHRTTPIDAARGTTVYSYGTVTLGLQLDAWARYEAARDALAAALEDALNRAPADTLGVAGLPRLRRRGGLVLVVPALLDAPCDFQLDAAPAFPDTPQSAQEGEWRASWAGTAFVHLLAAEQVALLKRIRLDFGSGEVRTAT